MKVLNLLLGAALVYLALLAAIWLLQDRLLYLPQRAGLAELTRGGLRAWPDAQQLRGLVAEPTGAVRGTAIVFHGNAGHAGHRIYYPAALGGLGLRVILAEYPGYGSRSGALGEASLVDDAQATLALAHAQYGPPLLLIGESLGAGVAAAAAARQADKVAGLLLITPWDRLAHVASYHYPWLPVERLLRDRYDSAAHLASFGAPVLVAVAEQDRIVPARFGAALHAALTGPKRLVVVAGADHNEWPDLVDERWWRDALAFVLGPSVAR